MIAMTCTYYKLYIGKWKTSFKNWPWQRFPIYFQGAGVVIAGSAARPILAAMQVTPYFIWDDMYLFGLCAVKAKVQLRTSNQYILDIIGSYYYHHSQTAYTYDYG